MMLMKLEMEMLHLPLPLVSLHTCPMMIGHSCHLAMSESVSDVDDDGDDDDDNDVDEVQQDVYSNDSINFHRVRVNCFHPLYDQKVEPLK